MPLTRLQLTNFTAFKSLQLDLDPGLNVFIGENATGKTHLLKVLYSACEITRSEKRFAEKLQAVFHPYQQRIGRLVHRTQGSATAQLQVYRDSLRLSVQFSNHAKLANKITATRPRPWLQLPVQSVFIPVKEMLTHAPGFRSLYANREVFFDETYFDLIDRAYLPRLRGPIDKDRRTLLATLENAIQGKVTTKGEFFFLRNSQGDLEFSLLAEGLRKLALLWILIQNGTLLKGTVLLWDEPEANLNPRIMAQIVKILLFLERLGVQIFIATHNYFILKEIELNRQPAHSVTYHSLFRDDSGTIQCSSTTDYNALNPNPITDTILSVYDAEIERALTPR